MFCYANAGVRKADQADEVLRFAEFWKQRTGRLPTELVFDSKLTTYANLQALNQMGIAFITLRRRSPGLVAELDAAPVSAWRRIELKGVHRAYRHPRILDRRITLTDYTGPLRQIAVAESFRGKAQAGAGAVGVLDRRPCNRPMPRRRETKALVRGGAFRRSLLGGSDRQLWRRPWPPWAPASSPLR